MIKSRAFPIFGTDVVYFLIILRIRKVDFIRSNADNRPYRKRGIP
jgi:hypothetical protein